MFLDNLGYFELKKKYTMEFGWLTLEKRANWWILFWRKGQKIAHGQNFAAKLFLRGQYHLLIGYGWWSTQHAMENDQHTKGWREGVLIKFSSNT